MSAEPDAPLREPPAPLRVTPVDVAITKNGHPSSSTVELQLAAPSTIRTAFLPAPPAVSVVIPVLNEARNIGPVLDRIPDWVHEVILVDGGSNDGTVEAAREVLPSVKVVHQHSRGKGAALRLGFEAVAGEIIAMLDGDGSTDPGELPLFVGALLAGADFVKGSRFAQGGGSADISGLRRLGNGGFTALTRVLFGNRCTDLCYGYNAFWRRLLPFLRLDVDGFEIETLMNVRALRAGLRVMEVPSFEARRLSGESRLRTFPDGWRVLKTIGRERWQHTLAHSHEAGKQPGQLS